MKRFKALGVIIICVFLCLSVTNTAFGDTVTLTVVPYSQSEYDHWCWAASSKMLLDYFYYGNSVTQSLLAYYGVQGNNTWDYLWGQGYCTGQPCCNDSIYRVGVNPLLTSYGPTIPPIPNGYGGPLPYYDDDDYTRDVWHEIRAGRPFIINWYYYGYCAGGHLLVGIGYDDGYVHYYNPRAGTGYCESEYGWVLNDYSTHYWAYTLWPSYSPYTPCVDDYISGSYDTVYPCVNTTLGYQNPYKYRCNGYYWVDTSGTTWDSYCSSGWEQVN
jgi:hypothetical protein